MSDYMVSLTVKTNTETHWSAAFDLLSQVATDHRESFTYVNLSSVNMDDYMDDEGEEELVLNEDTMDKVRQAIAKCSIFEVFVPNEDEITTLITSLQNAGIHFREIKK